MLCKAHIATLATKTTNPGRARFHLQGILNYSSQHPSELGIIALSLQLRMLRQAKGVLGAHPVSKQPVCCHTQGFGLQILCFFSLSLVEEGEQWEQIMIISDSAETLKLLESVDC